MAVDRKYERDVDLLLAEEFSVNPEFADWFLAHTKFKGSDATVASVRVSLADKLGESDLVIHYRRDNGDHFALLIEDKVDAPLQPNQAARYRLRGERDRDQNTFADFEVLLCAPQNYIELRTDLDGFDRKVSLEDIADFFLRGAPSARARYRGDFLRTAVSRRLNTWQREPDDLTDAFWRAAHELAIKEFPILEMQPLTATKDTTWISLRPRDLPTRPKHVKVIIKGDRGLVDLTFADTRVDKFSPTVMPLSEPDFTVHQTNKSSAIRIRTPAFEIADGIDNGLPRVRSAFEASSRLIQFYRRHRAALDAAAQQATPE